ESFPLEARRFVCSLLPAGDSNPFPQQPLPRQPEHLSRHSTQLAPFQPALLSDLRPVCVTRHFPPAKQPNPARPRRPEKPGLRQSPMSASLTAQPRRALSPATSLL